MKSLIIIVLIGFIAFVAHTTNPTTEDFEYYIEKQIKQELEISNESNDILTLIMFKIAKAGISLCTDRKDYKLFSIYGLHIPGEDYLLKAIGLFGNFIPLPNQQKLNADIQSNPTNSI